jgi:hypothetical protein
VAGYSGEVAPIKTCCPNITNIFTESMALFLRHAPIYGEREIDVIETIDV